MHHAINEYQLRLDVQHFLWPVYYIILYYIIYAGPSSCILGCNIWPFHLSGHGLVPSQLVKQGSTVHYEGKCLPHQHPMCLNALHTNHLYPFSALKSQLLCHHTCSIACCYCIPICTTLYVLATKIPNSWYLNQLLWHLPETVVVFFSARREAPTMAG